MLAVPALVLGLDYSMTQAKPVALLAVAISASLGAVDGFRKTLVQWRAGLIMALLGVVMAPFGVHLANLLPPKLVMTAFAVAMVAAAARLLWQSPDHENNALRPSDAQMGQQQPCSIDCQTGHVRLTTRALATLASIGALSGVLTGMLGVGGGFLIVPALTQWSNLKMHAIVATSLFVVALVALGATAGSVGPDSRLTGTGGIFIAAAALGVVVGRLAAPHLSSRTLQQFFAWLSFAVAAMLMIRSFTS